MAQHEASENKPKKRSRAGIVLLIIFLILAGAAGYLYYSAVKAPLALDDPQKLAASVPMSVEERFTFSAAEGTAQVKMDKGDIWYLFLDIAGNDFLDTVNEEVSPYGLTVSGCALHMDEAGLRLDLELFYKEIRLIARVPCNLEVSGSTFTLMPTGLKIGVLPLPVSGLLSRVKVEKDIILPVLDQVTQISFEQDAMLLTGTMEQDVRTLVPWDLKLNQTVLFCEEMQNLADSLEIQDGFSRILTHLEQNPGSAEDLYRDLFILTEFDVSRAYLADRRGLTQRFFPNIDFDAVAEKRTELGQKLGSQYVLLERFFSEAVNEYNGKRLVLSDGEFLQKDEPFLKTQFGYQMYVNLVEALDPESFFLILVDVENGYIRKTSSFYRMVDENQQFTRDVDFNKTYILGLVLRSVDGEPYLMYETEYHEGALYYRVITQVKLTEEDVAALHVPGAFGVWTD